MNIPMRRLLLLVMAVTLAGACNDSATPEKSDAAAKADDGIELVDDGATPRQELRFTLRVGDTFRSIMTMKTGVTMSFEGQQLPTTTLPAMQFVMSGRIDEVSADGEARYSYAIDQLSAIDAEGVDPAVLSQMDASLQAMKGVSGTGSIDRRGNAGPSTVDTSKITDATVKTTLESFTSQVSNLTVPFPSERVGPGAKWTAKRRALLNGVTTDTTSTYELKSVKGTGYELDIVQRVTAPKGPVSLPGMPAGSKAEIVNYRQDNSGSINGDLKRIMPIKSRTSGGGDIEMIVGEQGKTQKMLQTLTLDITVESL